MATDLKTYLAGKSCPGRKDRPVYFTDGDFVTFFCADDLAHEDRVDDLVTVYRSYKTGEMVGCKIKGVCRLLSSVGNFGVVIFDHGSPLTLGMLFLGAALANPEKRGKYETLGEQFGKVPFDAPKACAA